MLTGIAQAWQNAHDRAPFGSFPRALSGDRGLARDRVSDLSLQSVYSAQRTV
ncbi:hypothetical protein CHO01_40330 [Cellulomonas hominis]|uniref:Uncharacterized protein n=1 Tax=Cellulomonas hominis TaxID=156981 RepID=A0A511FKK1_9CELL|nr:hypothetical protein CHO01_40330 [Cellulomonas hominis]